MVQNELIVKNPTGIHARPASQLVKECSKYESRIIIKIDEKEINAKSIISILSAGLSKGSKITLLVEGIDEKEALNNITDFINELKD